MTNDVHFQLSAWWTPDQRADEWLSRSYWASGRLGVCNLIMDSLITLPVNAFLHLSCKSQKGLGLPLPCDSSVWLLTEMVQTCHGTFCSPFVCVCARVCVCSVLLCFSKHSWSVTENNPQLWSIAPVSVTSPITLLNYTVRKHVKNGSAHHTTTEASLNILICLWCWNRTGCDTVSRNHRHRWLVCDAVIYYLRMKYLPLIVSLKF